MKRKDGRTHLAHKAEHAVDMETGAVAAVTVQEADQGDTTTMVETVIAAAEQIERVVEEPSAAEQVPTPGLAEIVGGQRLSQQRIDGGPAGGGIAQATR